MELLLGKAELHFALELTLLYLKLASIVLLKVPINAAH
jgi:hypothetical protein